VIQCADPATTETNLGNPKDSDNVLLFLIAILVIVAFLLWAVGAAAGVDAGPRTGQGPGLSESNLRTRSDERGMWQQEEGV